MSRDDPYAIPGTSVLQNKLGITNTHELDRAERLLTTQRAREGVPAGKFDLSHLKAIHKHLFQDVYAWAGQLRTVDIMKDETEFQPRHFLETGFADIYRRIQGNAFLRGLDAGRFAAKAGEIIGDINYAHPFREGNGRTQLEYLRQLAASAGHPLDPGNIHPDEWIAASKAACNADYRAMSTIIGNQMLAQSFLDKTPEQRLADPRLRDAQLTLAIGFRTAEQQLGGPVAQLPDVADQLQRAVSRQLAAGHLFDTPVIKPPQQPVEEASLRHAEAERPAPPKIE